MPVLRVDDDVWKWLQGQARPFEDTPNSVLRRIARLDPELSAPPSRVPTIPAPSAEPLLKDENMPSSASDSPVNPTIGTRVTGAQLNRKHNLGARHALYHKDGRFYERLVRFPAVYCDTRGYVKYETEQQFVRDTALNIGEKVNVHRSLSAHPRYQRFPSAK